MHGSSLRDASDCHPAPPPVSRWTGRNEYTLQPTAERFESYELSFAAKVSAASSSSCGPPRCSTHPCLADRTRRWGLV
jgi:hypothetical protein